LQLLLLYFHCLAETRTEEPQQDAMQEIAPATSNEVKVEVTDFDRYEGKIV
jgi:hypothetical protein